ncbi:MAG TPA: long-chain-fatty-acid--CoA ligase [Myxococcota bacterium]|nr:long-chain-fatty-acid--CoA ligase [Myxococcota bacterium]
MNDQIRSIADVPRHHARVRPESVALCCEGRRMTWADLDQASNAFACGLRAIGAEGIAAYLGRNREPFVEALYGSAKAGWVLSAINWRLAPREIEYILGDLRPSILFAESEFLPGLEQIAERISVPKIICLDAVDPERSRLPDYSRWRSHQRSEDPEAEIAPERVMMIVYTSGTTGHPKGAEITNDNLMATLRLYEATGHDYFRSRPEDVHIAFQPFFHIGGSELVFQYGYYGCTSVLMPDFDVARFLKHIEEHNARRVALPPTVINMILDHPLAETTDFSRLRYITYGGAPITPALLRRAAKRWDVSFIGLFGQTESTGMGTYLPPEEHSADGAEHMASVGHPLPGMELKIVDLKTQADVGADHEGEICLRGDAVMAGYWKQPEATAKTIDASGWLRTGDIGYVDAHGYLYLKDRVKDMIISGGENIYSAEVEAVVAEHPAVNSVAVIGVPDELWGEAVKAVVVLHPGATASEREIIDFTGQRIARYKRPKSVTFVAELPRSANNKILKRELRDRYWPDRNAKGKA